MTDKRLGFFYLVGETNSGKSTLMNALMCKKVSIVTHKVQTTNVPFYASFMYKDAEVFLLDTPGIFKRENQQNINVRSINFVKLHEKNIIFLIDANRKDLSMSKKFLESLSNTNNIFLVINKIDKVQKEKLLQLIDNFKSVNTIKEIFLISALKKDGFEPLLNAIYEYTSEDNDMSEVNQYMHASKKFLFSEITREKIYENIHDEVPYFCRVETRVSRENIYQTILVPRKGYIPILVGEKGSKIKTISMASRLEINKITGQQMNLFVKVEVEKNKK